MLGAGSGKYCIIGVLNVMTRTGFVPRDLEFSVLCNNSIQ